MTTETKAPKMIFMHTDALSSTVKKELREAGFVPVQVSNMEAARLVTALPQARANEIYAAAIQAIAQVKGNDTIKAFAELVLASALKGGAA